MLVFHRAVLRERSKEVEELWARLTELRTRFWAATSAASREALLLEVDPRLSSWIEEEVTVISCAELGVRPLAEWLIEGAPSERRVQLGREPSDFDSALKEAARVTGVNLDTSRVRAGFSRGHLLEVVVQIPLDVQASEEDLQVAAEVFLEEYLGDRVLDDWVGDVSVDRIARTRGLVMAADSSPKDSSTEPLRAISEMIAAGVLGVTEQLPASLLHSSQARSDWLALEIPEGGEGLQPERRFASTCSPEALKAALEGLPFSSQRFTRGEEVFCYLEYGAQEQTNLSRAELRQRAEELVGEFSDEVTLTGTGFGPRTDYLDLWLVPTPDLLRRLGRSLSASLGSLKIGFYDTQWENETLSFP